MAQNPFEFHDIERLGEDLSRPYLFFLGQLWDEETEGRFLDLGCGSGRLVVGFAQEHPHYQVVGLDSSPQRLQLAQEKAQGLANLQLVQGDMRQFSLPGEFGLITCTDTLHHVIDSQDLGAIFGMVKKHLTEDGLFVFDFCTSRYFQTLATDTCAQDSGADWEYDPHKRLARATVSLPEGQEALDFRAYELEEVERSLQQAGLSIIDALSDIHQGIFDMTQAQRIYVVATKAFE